MRTLTTLIATVAMALAAIGLAVAAPGHEQAPDASLTAAGGAVRITNSREGQAVVEAGAMRPGQSVSGTVRIGNDGDVAGRFALRPTTLADTPGPYGGVMSEWAELVLQDVTSGRTLYAGTPVELGQVDLGTVAAGERRDYSVAVTLPDGGLGGADNHYQGSALSLGLEWVATPESPAPTPTQPPGTTSPPATTPPATRAPATTPRPPVVDPTGEALADALGLPSARRCVSRRRFRIRLRAPHGARVVSAVVRIKGRKPVRVRGGRRTTAPVDLRGLPKGKFKVRVRVRASNGRTYKSSRTYRTCAPKSKKARKIKHRRRR
jgi:hypothetical protein